jgi:hypothetical protein
MAGVRHVEPPFDKERDASGGGRSRRSTTSSEWRVTQRAHVHPRALRTQFDAHLLEADAKLDEYRQARAAVTRRVQAALAAADEPGIVADVVLQAAAAARPKLRYTAGRGASRLRWLRRFAPAAIMDAGIRKELQLDALTASMPPTLVVESVAVQSPRQ